MQYKKNIQKLIFYILKFVINENKYKSYDLLNNYIKFNLKCLKFSEVKLYLNNNYIIKIGFESYYIYKNLIDVNYQIINDIKKIDYNNYKIEDYYHNIYGNDAIIIKLYSNLYLKKEILPGNITEQKEDNKIIEFEPLNVEEQVDNKVSLNVSVNVDKSFIINEKSTILNDDELDVLNWLNN